MAETRAEPKATWLMKEESELAEREIQVYTCRHCGRVLGLVDIGTWDDYCGHIRYVGVGGDLLIIPVQLPPFEFVPSPFDKDRTDIPSAQLHPAPPENVKGEGETRCDFCGGTKDEPRYTQWARSGPAPGYGICPGEFHNV